MASKKNRAPKKTTHRQLHPKARAHTTHKMAGHAAMHGAHAKQKTFPRAAKHVTPAMKMWKTQLLNDPQVRQMLINVAGEHTLHVISEFDHQMSDEEISKKTALRTSDVRVVLNKLHSYGLVSYSRSRDRNSGWYSYVWKMNNDKARQVIQQMKGESYVDDSAAAQDDGEKESEYYYCKTCVPEKKIPFEQASGLLFRCASCGSNLDFLS